MLGFKNLLNGIAIITTFNLKRGYLMTTDLPVPPLKLHPTLQGFGRGD